MRMRSGDFSLVTSEKLPYALKKMFGKLSIDGYCTIMYMREILEALSQ
jgi:hypothetical protein